MKLHPVYVEKRRHVRHRARSRVAVHAPGIVANRLRMVNLSASGVCVATLDLGLSPGYEVELVFAIELGSIFKLHRRRARVVHLAQGATGFELLAQAADR